MTTLRSGSEEVHYNVKLFELNKSEGMHELNKIGLTLAETTATTKTRVQNELEELKKLSSGKIKQKETTAVNSSKGYLTNESLAYCPDKKRKKEKKSVSFSKKRQVRRIPPLSYLPEKVVEACWYSLDDFEIMSQEYEYLLFFMNKCDDELIEELVDEESSSSRGLECKTEDGLLQRFQNRRRAYNAVLNEQERQWREGVDNSFTIAELYQESTKASIDSALAKAKEDENDVQQYLFHNAIPFKGKVLSNDVDNAFVITKVYQESSKACIDAALAKAGAKEDESDAEYPSHNTTTPFREKVPSNDRTLVGQSTKVGQRCSPPPKKKRAVTGSEHKSHTNHDSSGDGSKGYSGPRWKPVPKGQRKSLLDVWK